MQLHFLTDDQPWVRVADGNPIGKALHQRHYSKYHYKDGRKTVLFVGPGEKMVLITKDQKALFVWRKFIDDSGQTGVNCAVFRNESSEQSSKLILAAEEIAHTRWPDERFYTYVNPVMVKSSNPGYCFLKAGWKKIGKTRKGLLIFEKKPEVDRH